MSRFTCPCGAVVEAETPSAFLAAVDAHDCPHHPRVVQPSEPAGLPTTWPGVVESLLFTLLVLGVCLICGWAANK